MYAHDLLLVKYQHHVIKIVATSHDLKKSLNQYWVVATMLSAHGYTSMHGGWWIQTKKEDLDEKEEASSLDLVYMQPYN